MREREADDRENAVGLKLGGRAQSFENIRSRCGVAAKKRSLDAGPDLVKQGGRAARRRDPPVELGEVA